jgi:glycosyltransferase involved in cell wall biosynthesis
MKVLHVITDFDDGGAQAVLYRFIAADKENTHHVISLMKIGYYGHRSADVGIQVHALDMPKSRLTLNGLTKLYRLAREINPDIVQTWMYHSDLIGGTIARVAGKPVVIWGIHNSNLDPTKTATTTRITARICGILSGNVPKKIISCSEEGIRVHQAIGYQPQKMVVVPNGYDVSEFSPKPETRIDLRNQWQIAENTTLFGMVARWDPQKDHANLIAALAHLKARELSPWHCILVGSNMSEDNQILVALLEQHGVRDRVSLLGIRTDIPAIMNAIDLHVLPSAYGEAFPNVVSEAMACGTPCIVTKVGDSALIVGETGWVVPPSDALKLADMMANAIQEMSNPSLWTERKIACRSRIQENFSLQGMIDSYIDVWKSAVVGNSKSA